MFRNIVASVTLLALSSTPLLAQTAEETVAYLVFGLEDGSRNAEFSLSWKQTSTSPAVYVSGAFKRSVRRVSNCNYVLSDEAVTGSKTDLAEWHIDFSKLNDLTVTPKAGPGHLWTLLIAGAGLCRYDIPSRKCAELNKLDLASDSFSPERHKKAYEFLRSGICKGRAF